VNTGTVQVQISQKLN